MVEITVVMECLTDDMIAGGRELMEALDRQGWPLTAALWLFDSEVNRWRLLLASPAVPRDGIRESYHQVNEASRTMKEPLSDDYATVVPPDHPVVQALAAYYPGQPERPRRIKRTRINRQDIDGAYVYRLPETSEVQRVGPGSRYL